MCVVATSSMALTLSFENISANNVANAAAGEAQLFVEVIDAGSGQVSFRFYNVGPVASSIADVYFDDGSLLGIATLVDADDGVGGDPGVDFSQYASPANLPGANNAVPPFVATAGFTADSDAPAQPNGVNPGEQLIVIFDLQGTQTYADVLAELDSGALRIGIHVQGFADGGSESFVNNGHDNGVPDGGTTTLLLGMAMLALEGLRRKIRK